MEIFNHPILDNTEWKQKTILIHSYIKYRIEGKYPSDRRSSRWEVKTAGACAPSQHLPNVLETPPEESHVLCKTRERECHRVDIKNAAFVKMRDSVSFCKQILIEYVLRSNEGRGQVYIWSREWSVRGRKYFTITWAEKVSERRGCRRWTQRSPSPCRL